MSNQAIFIIMGVTGTILVLITIIYIMMNKKMQKSEYKKLQKLRQGTKANKNYMLHI